MRSLLLCAVVLSVLGCERPRRAVTLDEVAVYRLPRLENDPLNSQVASLAKGTAVMVIDTVDIKTTFIYKVDLGAGRTGYVPSTPKLHFIDRSVWEVEPRR